MLDPCPKCRRHIRGICPFCASLPSVTRGAAIGAALLALACGPSPTAVPPHLSPSIEQSPDPASTETGPVVEPEETEPSAPEGQTPTPPHPEQVEAAQPGTDPDPDPEAVAEQEVVTPEPTPMRRRPRPEILPQPLYGISPK